jgi:hypothetical protein
VAVGEEAAVRQEASTDHGPRILARLPPLDPPGKELEADDARVLARFVGIPVPDVIEERRSESLRSPSSASTFAQPMDPSGHPGRKVASYRCRKRV